MYVTTTSPWEQVQVPSSTVNQGSASTARCYTVAPRNKESLANRLVKRMSNYPALLFHHPYTTSMFFLWWLSSMPSSQNLAANNECEKWLTTEIPNYQTSVNVHFSSYSWSLGCSYIGSYYEWRRESQLHSSLKAFLVNVCVYMIEYIKTDTYLCQCVQYMSLERHSHKTS